MKLMQCIVLSTISFGSWQMVQAMRLSSAARLLPLISAQYSTGVELCGICRQPGQHIAWPSPFGQGAHARCFERLADQECNMAFALTVRNLLRSPRLNGQLAHVNLVRELDRYVEWEGFASIKAHLDSRGIIEIAAVYDQLVSAFERDSNAEGRMPNSTLRRLHALRETLKDIVRLQKMVPGQTPPTFLTVHSPIMVCFLYMARVQNYATIQEYVQKNGIGAFADFYEKQLDAIVNGPTS